MSCSLNIRTILRQYLANADMFCYTKILRIYLDMEVMLWLYPIINFGSFWWTKK